MWALAVASFTASYRVLVVFSGPFGIFITDHWWVPADQVFVALASVEHAEPTVFATRRPDVSGSFGVRIF